MTVIHLFISVVVHKEQRALSTATAREDQHYMGAKIKNDQNAIIALKTNIFYFNRPFSCTLIFAWIPRIYQENPMRKIKNFLLTCVIFDRWFALFHGKRTNTFSFCRARLIVCKCSCKVSLQTSTALNTYLITICFSLLAFRLFEKIVFIRASCSKFFSHICAYIYIYNYIWMYVVRRNLALLL